MTRTPKNGDYVHVRFLVNSVQKNESLLCQNSVGAHYRIQKEDIVKIEERPLAVGDKFQSINLKGSAKVIDIEEDRVAYWYKHNPAGNPVAVSRRIEDFKSAYPTRIVD